MQNALSDQKLISIYKASIAAQPGIKCHPALNCVHLTFSTGNMLHTNTASAINQTMHTV